MASRIQLPEPFIETERITREKVLSFLEQLIELYRPERILVFGSYANGIPDEDSDIDFLVVMPYEGRQIEKIIEICTAIPRKFPVDILIRRPLELKAIEDSEDWIGGTAWREGRVIYAA